jgi:hypothetical protein
MSMRDVFFFPFLLLDTCIVQFSVSDHVPVRTDPISLFPALEWFDFHNIC